MADSPKVVQVDRKKIQFLHKDGKKEVESVVVDGGAPIPVSPKGPLKKAARAEIRLDGINPVSIAEGAVLITEVNPVCIWYFYGGCWWVYCY